MSHSFRRPSPLLLLFAAALVLRALLPSGWMPQAGQDGVHITLCTGSGTVMATLAPDGTLRKDAPASGSARDPCPYAVGTAALDLPELPVFSARFQFADAAKPAARAATAPVIRRSLRPPARGPPVFA